MKKLILLLSLLAGPLAPRAAADEWPMWRGPKLNGHSDEKNLPTRWSPTENIAWKVPIPGKGHSSPILFGDRVFLTTAIEREQKRMLLCLNRLNGNLLWEKEVLSAPLEQKHSLNNYASATPATDGQRIYVAFLDRPNVRLVCYDMDGNELWRISPGTFRSMHGWAAAPILHKNLVIVNCDQDADGFLAAFDKLTGNEVWRTPRPNRTRSYCVPLIVEAPAGSGKMQMVLTGSKCTAGYDPDTGKEIWLVDGPTEQFVASPVFSEGLFFITGGFPTFHYMGITPAGRVVYHERTGAYVPSPIAVGKHVYMVSDDGMGMCIDIATGDRLWSHRLGKHHRPSPVFADGLLYFLSDEGDTFVIKASPKFELISKNSLNEDCFASPAISRGQIFIRTTANLYCIGRQQEAAGQ
jgi:outer membrane protein assembly factor BamB